MSPDPSPAREPEPVQAAATALIILGMHRSGTSALAGQCASLGFWLGDDLLPPVPANPKGFFEDVELMRANDRLVTLLFGGWTSPLSWAESAAEMPLAHPRIGAIVQAIRAVLERLGAHAPMWAVKDPRISRLLPLWWPLLRTMGVEARLVMALRRPDEVVASLASRDAVGTATARLMWLRHVAEPLAYAFERDLPLTIVPYETLLAAPERLAETLAAMGFPVRPAGEAFVDRTLRHHRHEAAPAGDAVSALCARLYGALAARDVAEWRNPQGDVAAVVREARDLPAELYLRELYRETLGISSEAQRLFYERRKERVYAQQRARRQRRSEGRTGDEEERARRAFAPPASSDFS